MARRSPGEGSILQRQDGRWQGSLQIDGRRVFVYGATRAEAAEKLQGLIGQAKKAGHLPDAGKLTLADYLERWLEQASPRLRPKTYHDYATIVRVHLTPQLGRHKLARLRPLDVARAYAALSKGGMSKRRLQQAHGVLHKALGDAVRWGLLPNNPAALVDVPKREQKEKRLWTPEQTSAFIEAMLDGANSYDCLLAFLLASGCRIGEALGLEWGDIDWQQGRVRIERQITELQSKPLLQEPKTRAGIRSIALPEWGMKALRQQKAKVNEWRLACGPSWVASNRVFPTTVGTVPLQGNVRRALHQACDRLGLPKIRPHDLRHLHLSLLATAGVSVKVAQQRAGHSSPMVTMQVYQHVLGDGDRLAAEALDGMLRKAGRCDL